MLTCAVRSQFTGKSRGFGFVELLNPGDPEAALELDGYVFYRRARRLQPARLKEGYGKAIAFGPTLPIPLTLRKTMSRQECHCAVCDSETERAIQAETEIMHALGIALNAAPRKKQPKDPFDADRIPNSRPTLGKIETMYETGEETELVRQSRPDDQSEEIMRNLGLTAKLKPDSARMALTALVV